MKTRYYYIATVTLNGRTTTAFELAPHRRKRGKWEILRSTIQCYENFAWSSPDEAMRWASSLNPKIEWRQVPVDVKGRR